MRTVYLGIFFLILLAQVGFLYVSDTFLTVPPTQSQQNPVLAVGEGVSFHLTISDNPFLDDEERILHTNFIAKIRQQMESRGRLADPYIFVHIAKTGGSSLYKSLMRARGPGLVLSHFWHHESVPDPAAIVAKNIPKGAVHVVGGHLCYGLHHWWENRTRSDHTYFTILRDPISRVMSHYRYHLNPSDANFYLTQNRTFTEWARTVKYAQNVMTGFMAGVEPYAWWNRDVPRLESDSVLFPHTVITEEQYRIARRHLITSIVGLQEEYESSLEMFSRYFGVELVYNHVKAGAIQYDFTEQERAVIAMVNHWDIELYKLGMYLYHQLQQLAEQVE